MHTLWKGALSFGLVYLPVKLHSATEDKDITMKQIHRICSSPISLHKTCNQCNKDVASEDLVKGYEFQKNQYILFEKEELDQLLPDSNKEIKIMDFVSIDEIDPIYFQKTYYLSPDSRADKGYTLLMEALKTTSKIGICKVSIRAKSSLGAIRVINNCLVLETLYYSDEIRPIQDVPNIQTDPVVDPKELSMAQSIVQHLSVAFEPTKYQDDYRNQLNDVINKKIQGDQIQYSVIQQKNNVLDLMSALQASLDALNQSKSKKTIKSKGKRKKEQTA
ncbi:Ku protein [Paenibacillus anaericanus]|uniref:Non-homologous end joining protein Ku n=1 Tax=Paenibacillus anaericanus TaxID=170367 RepID=A0A3S1DRC1_9BACL|nr:Ku protein [Paenibacillus anaericanus]RUT47365.1 Ku protein [Paenibacillus anaericanus]